MNHCFEICHYQQNVPQHYYLLDTLVIAEIKANSLDMYLIVISTLRQC